MWRPEGARSVRPPGAEGQAPPGIQRDRLAVLLAIATVVCLGLAFILSKGTQFLMPGPLASAHGAIENCSACHTKSGSGKLSFLHGLVAGDPLADSKACLTCHKMPDTAFNAHGASAEVLKRSTERLVKIAAQTPQPQSARAQNTVFPTHDVVSGGLYCATCHQEHQGLNFKLSKISNEQCRSCHVVKFDSFDGHHPKFDNYPFNRRTQIIYDHAGHFGKHYPEVAKKEPETRIPDTCSTCHNSREDKRVMAVAPFEQTCTGCHLDQIIGKERASGPKGIAFLTLPGLDLETLNKKNARVGEWPEASEAALTPFMKVMLSRGDRGRALIETVDSLNLQDLSGASDGQIKAVTNLVWEIKGLFYALISGKASDVLGDLNIGGGGKLAANLVSDLTASIPRDVLISAHQEWLPNLATEMANRPVATDQDKDGWSTTISDSNLGGSASPEALSGWDAQIDPYGRVTEKPDDKAEAAKAIAAELGGAAKETDAANAKSDGGEETLSAESPSPEAIRSEPASKAITNEQACTVSFFGQCLLSKGPEGEVEAAKSEGAAGETDTANPKSDGGGSADAAPKGDLEAPVDAPAGADTPGVTKDADRAGRTEGAAGKTYITNAGPEDGTEAPSSEEGGGEGPIIKRFSLPSGTSRAIGGSTKDAEKPARPEEAAGTSDAAKAKRDDGKESPPANEEPRATNAGTKDAEKASQPEGAAGNSNTANTGAPSADAQPQGNATDQKDDLLFPTEEELRAIKAGSGGNVKAAQPEEAAGKSDAGNARSDDNAADADAPSGAPAGSDTAAARPQTRGAPVISIKSDVDPESWAEYGGWYQQDHAIFYRPTGHKDKFIYSWLFLTGPQAPKGDKGPAAAVFDVLTGKDAQGSCTKCHSVDDIQGKARLVNFSPPSVANKNGRFTNFIHEPHFGLLENRVSLENRVGILENRGCLTCHTLEKGRPYLKSYEQGNPQNFVSNFGEVNKELCQTCHTSSMARQDCLTCHKYHVNGVVTPIISTKLPTQ
jgi:hypothetical protein